MQTQNLRKASRFILFGVITISSFSLSGQDVKTVIEKYLRNVGGRDQIERIKTSSLSYRSFSLYPKIDSTFIELKQILPKSQLIRNYYNNGKLRYESIINKDSLNIYVTEPYPNKIVNYFNDPIYPDPSTEILQLYKLRNLSYSQPETLGAIECQILKTNYVASLKKPAKTFYFYNETGLLAAQKVNDNITLYKNYQATKSILYPFLQEHYLNSSILNIDIYEKVEFNINLDIRDFKPKSTTAPPLRKVDSEYNKIEYVDSKYSDGSFQDLIKYFEGKRILIDLWATWCGPCKYEFTKYDDNLYAYLKGKGIDLVFISLDKAEKEKEWRNDILWFNLNGYHIMAGKSLNNSLKKELNEGNPFAIPRYVLINEHGEILSKDIGKPSSTDFRNKVSKLLN